MADEDVLVAAALEEACLTTEDLACACAVSEEWVIHHVREGALARPGDMPGEWRFTSRDLWRARHIRRLERDFDAAPELAALMADLLEELEGLRARLRRIGLG